MGVSYGICMLVIGLVNGHEFRLGFFLFSTLIFGTTMSLFSVSVHIRRLKKIGVQKITSDNLKVSQNKVLKSKLTKAMLIEKLQIDPLMGKMKMTEIEQGLIIETGMTWKSRGEEIKIIISSFENKLYEYQISSKPKLKPTLVDFGRNLENVNRIESLLISIA